MNKSIKRDGNWMDEWGACKVCDGELPHGHSDNCDIYKLEQKIRQFKNTLMNNKYIIDKDTLLLAKHIIDNYAVHTLSCEWHMTDCCLCGFAQSIKEYREKISDLTKLET